MTDFVKSIKIFNEKVDKITNLSFTKKVISSNIRIQFFDNTMRVAKSGPDMESIDAFILTYRFFIQDNERSSIRTLSYFYNKLNLPIHFKNKFNHLRNEINEYLNKDLNISIGDEVLKKREIQDIFIYGSYAHTNDKKHSKYLEITKNKELEMLFEYELVMIFSNMLYFLNKLKILNLEVLSFIDNNDGA